MLEKKKITPLFFQSYLRAIENSVGSHLFRNFYCSDGKKIIDIYQNGNLSCAYFVSAILVLFGFLSHPRATVSSLLESIKKARFLPIDLSEMKKGDIILWEKKLSANGWHQHIGFYLGVNQAVSNSPRTKTPIIHHYTFNNKRKIIAIYRVFS